jgi:hypothetical protein
MSKFKIMSAVVALALGVAFAPATSQADATKATVTVIHAIPGLPEPVEVFANGGSLFTFDYKDVAGPLDLEPGTYDLEVKLAGTTVLSASATVEAGKNYTAIAHLTNVPGGDPGIALSLFENSAMGTGPGRTRLTVRHVADAPAVDIDLYRGGGKRLVAGAENVSNTDGGTPGQVGPVAIRPGAYRASLYVAGTETLAFESDKVVLNPHEAYVVYAIGSISGGTFELFVQKIETGK